MYGLHFDNLENVIMDNVVIVAEESAPTVATGLSFDYRGVLFTGQWWSCC